MPKMGSEKIPNWVLKMSKKTKNLGMIGLEVLFSIQMFIFQNLSCAHYEMVVTKTKESTLVYN